MRVREARTLILSFVFSASLRYQLCQSGDALMAMLLVMMVVPLVFNSCLLSPLPANPTNPRGYEHANKDMVALRNFHAPFMIQWVTSVPTSPLPCALCTPCTAQQCRRPTDIHALGKPMRRNYRRCAFELQT